MQDLGQHVRYDNALNASACEPSLGWAFLSQATFVRIRRNEENHLGPYTPRS